MSKLKLPYPLNSISSRPGLLLPTALISVILLVYWKFAWFFSPAPLLTVPEPVLNSGDLPRILIVSALFPLEHAKHSHEEYKSWLRNFLGEEGIQSDIYFYTTPDLETLVSSLDSSRLTINTIYNNPFAIPPLSPYQDKYREMHAWDRERALHSPELYAVWNAKPWLLQHALMDRGGNYDYAFWVDAGSFRAAHPFRMWPDPARVQEIFLSHREGADRMSDRVLIPLFTLPGNKQHGWRVENGPVDMDFSEGSFFGSTPSGISWYSKTFYETHDNYINTTPPPQALHPHEKPDDVTPLFHFVGKDQTLINAILFRYPSRFLGVLAPSRIPLVPPLERSDSYPYALTLSYLFTQARVLVFRALGYGKACGDWYYYQWWLAASNERERARTMGWERCGETGTKVLEIEALLRGLFGSRWVEGRRAGGG
ncbi:hypothetical protein H0H92_014970 [Tricholoma furcatifolium]|nr:hypothetical protein H0H92_014970 [Tricholoma furcatifolium]